VSDDAIAHAPDDREPSAERQAELRAAYERNVAAGSPPYAGCDLHTRGEVLWAVRERGWSASYDPERRQRANLSGASFFGANLRGVTLRYADLSGAFFFQADLTSANLYRADLRGANLVAANLSRANLRHARMDAGTELFGTTIDDRTLLADLVWNGVPATRLNWQDIATLGDEYRARQTLDDDGKPKERATRLRHLQHAVLANRQVATLLRGQGQSEHADRYAYRAQVLQRRLLIWQRHFGRAFGSWLLDLVAGYGYKPLRSLIAYVVIICLFASAYLLNAQFAAPHLSWDEALVLSISSFHGRGFFTSGISLGDTLARLAAGEAIIGLLIEITFIATFTQRFFAR
jgi:hypothetical protein